VPDSTATMPFLQRRSPPHNPERTLHISAVLSAVEPDEVVSDAEVLGWWTYQRGNRCSTRRRLRIIVARTTA
jgi:hypothetical protein